MALHAHTVDVACSSDRLEKLDDVILLGSLIFVVIVVEELDIGRSVLSCELESLLYEVFADRLCPVALSDSAAVVNALVADVPGVDNAGVILLAIVDNGVNVVLHSLEHEVSACELSVDIVVLIEEPGRCL